MRGYIYVTDQLNTLSNNFFPLRDAVDYVGCIIAELKKEDLSYFKRQKLAIQFISTNKISATQIKIATKRKLKRHINGNPIGYVYKLNVEKFDKVAEQIHRVLSAFVNGLTYISTLKNNSSNELSRPVADIIDTYIPKQYSLLFNRCYNNAFNSEHYRKVGKELLARLDNLRRRYPSI